MSARTTTALAALAALAGTLGPGAAAARTPARMLVYAQEWSLYGSRATLAPGRVTVQLWNRGQDAHDLRIRRLTRGRRTGPVLGRVAVTQSGALRQSSWTLASGHYELYCSLPGHLMKGMHFTLTVR